MKNILCLIAKNEASYILEWIAYHKAIGFVDFVIYDNLSQDGTTDILKKLESKKLIKHYIQKENGHGSPQRLAYNDCIKRFRDKTDLITFIDTDEFITSPSGKNIPEHISGVFLENPDMSAMALNWRIFGSSGKDIREDGFVIERFTKSCQNISSAVKSIIRPSDATEMFTHYVQLSKGRYGDENGQPVEFNKPSGTPAPGNIRVPSAVNIQINHYMVKSKEEFKIKESRGNANYQSNHPDKYKRFNSEYFEKYDINEINDVTALATT